MRSYKRKQASWLLLCRGGRKVVTIFRVRRNSRRRDRLGDSRNPGDWLLDLSGCETWTIQKTEIRCSSAPITIYQLLSCQAKEFIPVPGMVSQL